MDPERASDAAEVEALYQYGDRLSEAKDKHQHIRDYEGILRVVKGGSTKAKQLAAMLIPRYFKYFPGLAADALSAHFDLLEEEELGIRVQAIRGLPLLCKDTPDNVISIVSVLGQILVAEDNVERDAVHKALMSLLRQDAKASLTGLFNQLESSDDNIREKVVSFLKDKVFPLKSELLKPQEQMERHVNDLVKRSVQDVNGAEFKMFMDFLSTLSIYGERALPEHVQELIEVIEAQADLDAPLDVSDVDQINRFISCLYIAIPFFKRSASSSKFLGYYNGHILPIFDKIPEERKLDLLKTLAKCSLHATPQDSRQLLPSVVQLLKKYLPRRKTGDAMSFNHVECLLYTFHHLAHKTPNSTNSLCGYKIVTGQPSDQLGADFSDSYSDFTERLNYIEDQVRGAMKKLMQGLTEHNYMTSAAKTEVADTKKLDKQNSTNSLRICKNILAMAEPLHSKVPSFIGDSTIRLSWEEAVKPAPAYATATAGGKRSIYASNASTTGVNTALKRGRGNGGVQNKLLSRAFEGLPHRGRGRGREGRGRGWGGHGRGWGHR